MNQAIGNVVGVFASADTLEGAAEDLMSHGFDRAQLSILGTDQAVAEHYGMRPPPLKALMDDPQAPRLPYIDHHELAIGQGALVSAPFYVTGVLITLMMAASGAAMLWSVLAGLLGGFCASLFGLLFARRVGRATATKIQGELNRGGVVLWVTAAERDAAARAMRILKRHGGQLVHRRGPGDDGRKASPALSGVTK